MSEGSRHQEGSHHDNPKMRVAQRALDFVTSGMKIGLGTGSTAALFVAALGQRVALGLDVLCVPTSEATRLQASALHIQLTTLDETPQLDLTIDGTDEFDPQMRLIKGGGGALLREKIVAAASAGMVVIADSSKQVASLGRFPLPVEVNVFGLTATLGAVQRVCRAHGCTGEVVMRQKSAGGAFVTDGGHLILDCHFGAIHAPEALSAALFEVPGVVEHGLFLSLATCILVADHDSVRIIERRV